MRKSKSRLIKNITFASICILFIVLLSYLYYNKTEAMYKGNTWEEKVANASKIFNLKKPGQVDQSSPRDLFIAFSYATFYAWCGWFKEIPIAFNCICKNPPINITENERSELIIKCVNLSSLLAEIPFSLNDIPEKVAGNTCNIKLGYGENIFTFYLARRRDGTWYFTEKNFNDPKAINIFHKSTSKDYFLDSEGRDYTSPLFCYIYFMLGTLNFTGLDIDTSKNVLDLSWVDPIVRDNYGNFLVLILSKVIEEEGVNIFAIPRDPPEHSVAILLCSSKKYGYSIYLERKDLDKAGNSTWIFNREVQNNALNIYSKGEMNISQNDPIWLKIQLWITHMIYSNTKFGAAIYLWILLIGGAFVAFAIYAIISKLLYFIINNFHQASHISHFKKYTKRVSMSSGLLIALYIYEMLNYYNVIFYYQLYVWFVYLYTIAYGILFIWFTCELINLICTVISLKLDKNSSERFRIAFVIEIIQRLLSLLAIVVITGILFQILGINMINFLTALGIAGMAVAFAGKNTIENLFGSIIIALEHPFKIGDWIIVNNIEGTVEHVGLRSTRIRTFQDSYITVPNVQFITYHVNNMNERSYRRYYTTLEVDESTPPELLKLFTTEIDKIIRNTPTMRQNEYHIKINDIGHFSIKIMIYVFFIAPDWEIELQEREKFILNLLKLAKRLNIKISYYPSQTLYFNKHEPELQK